LHYCRHEYACRSLHAVEGDTTPGLRLFRCTLETFCVVGALTSRLVDLQGHRHLFGNGPHEAYQFAGDGDDDLVRVFPACQQFPIAFTEAYLRLPAEVLDGCGWCFEPELYMSTDFGGVAISPGPFDEGPTGMAIPSFGDGTLPTALPTGVFRGKQSQAFHALPGSVKARQVPQFRHRELHAAQGLEGRDHRL
jgi:hypothetical protein